MQETGDLPTKGDEKNAVTLIVPVDAWQNPEDGEIYFEARVLKQLDDIQAQHMGL